MCAMCRQGNEMLFRANFRQSQSRRVRKRSKVRQESKQEDGQRNGSYNLCSVFLAFFHLLLSSTLDGLYFHVTFWKTNHLKSCYGNRNRTEIMSVFYGINLHFSSMVDGLRLTGKRSPFFHFFLPFPFDGCEAFLMNRFVGRTSESERHTQTQPIHMYNLVLPCHVLLYTTTTSDRKQL